MRFTSDSHSRHPWAMTACHMLGGLIAGLSIESASVSNGISVTIERPVSGLPSNSFASRSCPPMVERIASIRARYESSGLWYLSSGSTLSR